MNVASSSSDRVLKFVEKMTLHDPVEENFTFFFCQPCNGFYLSKELWLSHISERDHKKSIVRWRQCQDLKEEQMKQEGSLQTILKKTAENVVGLDYVVEICSPKDLRPHHWVCLLCSFSTPNSQNLQYHLLNFAHKDQFVRTNRNQINPPARQDCDPKKNRLIPTQDVELTVNNYCTNHAKIHGQGTMRTYAGGWLQVWSESKEREDEEEMLLKAKTEEVFNNPSAFDLDSTYGPISRSVVNSEYENAEKSHIIGLQYLIELWLPNRRIVPVFYCVLCETLMIDWKEHTQCFRHVALYLEKHYKTVYNGVISQSIDEQKGLENFFRANSMVLQLEGRKARTKHVEQLKLRSYESFLPLNVTLLRRFAESLKEKNRLDISPPPIASEVLLAKNEDLNSVLEKLVKESCSDIVKADDKIDRNESKKVDNVTFSFTENGKTKPNVAKNAENVTFSFTKSSLNPSQKNSFKRPMTRNARKIRNRWKKYEKSITLLRENIELNESKLKPNSNETKKLTTSEIMARSSDRQTEQRPTTSEITARWNGGHTERLTTSEIMTRSNGYSIKRSAEHRLKVTNMNASTSSKASEKGQFIRLSTNEIVERSKFNKRTDRNKNHWSGSKTTNSSSIDNVTRKRGRSPDRNQLSISKPKKHSLNEIKIEPRSFGLKNFSEKCSSTPILKSMKKESICSLSKSDLEILTKTFRDVGVNFGRRLTMDDVETIRLSVGSETCDRLLDTYLKKPNSFGVDESSRNSSSIPVNHQLVQLPYDVKERFRPSRFTEAPNFVNPDRGMEQFLSKPSLVVPQTVSMQPPTSHLQLQTTHLQSQMLPQPTKYMSQVVAQTVVRPRMSPAYARYSNMAMPSGPLYRDSTGQMFVITRHSSDYARQPVPMRLPMNPNLNRMCPPRFF